MNKTMCIIRICRGDNDPSTPYLPQQKGHNQSFLWISKIVGVRVITQQEGLRESILIRLLFLEVILKLTSYDHA